MVQASVRLSAVVLFLLLQPTGWEPCEAGLALALSWLNVQSLAQTMGCSLNGC